jgi:hypothetical protein
MPPSTLVAPLIPIKYEQISVDAITAVQLTRPSKTIDGDTYQARACLIIAEDNGYRWRDDGEDPTPGVGMPVDVGSAPDMKNAATQLDDFRVIAQAGTAKLNIAWYH